jgi:hypothetical protein
MKYRLPLHVQISTIFLALILLVGGIIGGLGYKISRDILESTASELNTRISRETLSEFSSLIGPSEMAVRLLSFDGVSQATSLEARMTNIGFMREALEQFRGAQFDLYRLWQRRFFHGPAPVERD